MESHHYLASTYLRVLRSDTQVMQLIGDALGHRLDDMMAAEYINGAEIDATFQAFAGAGLNSWVLNYGERVSIASHGPLGFTVLSAPDLHTALSVLAEYTVIRLSIYSSDIRYVDNRVELIYQDKTGHPLIGRWLIESGFSVAQKLIETIMAHPLGDNANIHFAFSEPDYAAELEAFYGIKCAYDAPEHCLSIPASWCTVASPLSDPMAFASNLQKCQEVRLQLEGGGSLAASVRLAFADYFSKRGSGKARIADLPTLHTLADANHLSPRTLARKLKAQGTSYKGLLEEARRQRAGELLSTTHLTIAEIADRLAYQEPANFVRAFKSWYQVTPMVWRRSLPASVN